MQLGNLVVCGQLERLLKASFSDEYAERQSEYKQATEEKQGVEGDQELQIMPLFILDPILPRQRLNLNIFEPRYLELIRRCRVFGMMGSEHHSARSSGGPAQFGTEVEVVNCSGAGRHRVHAEVVGRRVFRTVGPTWTTELGLNMARVEFVTLQDETAPSETLLQLQELGSLWERWLEMVKSGWERWPRHMVSVIEDLGAMPTDASRRALWIAAGINPLPALGVAPEIRPLMLSAPDAQTRVRVACDGIKASLAYLESAERSKVRRLIKWLTALVKRVTPQCAERVVLRAAPLIVIGIVSVLWNVVQAASGTTSS